MRCGWIPWLLAVLTVPVGATAQRVDGGPWRPELSLDPNALPTVEGTLVPGPGQWNVGALVEYVHNPLVGTDAHGVSRAIVSDQVWTTFSLQVGIGTHFAAGLQVPALMVQSSAFGPGEIPAVASAGIGDLRGVFRWSTRTERSTIGQRTGGTTTATQQQTEAREGLGLSLGVAATAPTAGIGTYAGAGAPTVEPFGVLDFRLARILGAVTLGYHARLDSNWPAQSGDCSMGATSVACLYDTPLRDQFTWGIAVRQPLEGLISLMFLRAAPNLASAAILTGYFASTYITLDGAVDARAPFARSVTSPVEMGAGLQRQQGEYTITLGASWGLVDAPGVAATRILAGVQWAPRFIDEDGDGFRDDPSVDHCIGLAEDFDGYQDDDGCPEDNDHDAIPDDEDRCPFVDEDEDGFQDEDGCPDPDNDGDGILDEQDDCPNEAPGAHPDPARPGCPLRASATGAPTEAPTGEPPRPAMSPAH